MSSILKSNFKVILLLGFQMEDIFINILKFGK